MPDPMPSAGPVDLDALDAFLLSDRAPEDGMGLSDLDGFLAGIAVGPELVMPSEWLPVVWGGGEPAFRSTEEASTVPGIHGFWRERRARTASIGGGGGRPAGGAVRRRRR